MTNNKLSKASKMPAKNKAVVNYQSSISKPIYEAKNYPCSVHETLHNESMPVVEPMANKPVGNQLPFGVQAKLKIGQVNDPYEQEADRVAEQIMRMPDSPISSSGSSSSLANNDNPVGGIIQRVCEPCSAEYNAVENEGRSVDRANLCSICRNQGGCGLIQTKAAGVSIPEATPAISSYVQSLQGGGRLMSGSERSFFEPRFGVNFSGVRVHDDARAASVARSINARAFTLGSDVVFGAGEYSAGGAAGRKLLAHELTHVVQQRGKSDHAIQRSCNDPDFCKPYATQAEADSAEWWIRNIYLRAEGVETFGTEVKSLYEAYLSRSPGDSLAPVIFDSDSSYLVSSFKNSGDTTDDMDSVIDLIGDRLNQAPSPSLRDGRRMTMSLSNFLSTYEMENRPINYSNPFSVAGHIAGGIGGSDAGNDYRKITYANVALEKSTLFDYVTVELIPHYEVFDTIDFCPGDCGSPLEQSVTIPMSRLEASGAAYDVPFKVLFTPEPRSKGFWV